MKKLALLSVGLVTVLLTSCASFQGPGVADYNRDGVISDATWGDQQLTLERTEATEPYFFDPLVRAGRYSFSHAPFGGAAECCGPTGLLIISDVTADAVTIAVQNYGGGPSFNSAWIDPSTVPLTEGRAVFSSSEEGLDCSFEIVVFDGFAFVDHVGERFDCAFGNAASVVGNYVLTLQMIPATGSGFFEERLNYDSFGPVALGDTWAELTQRLGVPAYDPETSDEISDGCNYVSIANDPLSPWFMMLGDGDASVVSRIELVHASQVTDAGVGLGNTEADVLAAYPGAIQSEPHHYIGGNAKYLRVIANDSSRDDTTILFETDESGLVVAFRNGFVDPVRWIEGCA